jgi:hypothetical protein
MNRFHEPRISFREPTKYEKGTSNLESMKNFQQSNSLFFDAAGIFIPIPFIDLVRKSLYLEIFLDIDGKSISNRSWMVASQNCQMVMLTQGNT